MKGNEEAAMGLNILKSEYLKKEALKSIQNQKMYLGPFKTKTGWRWNSRSSSCIPG
jgi:hypothetical protein